MKTMIFVVIASCYCAASIMLTGYSLHRIKYSQRKDGERDAAYCSAYFLLFVVPTMPFFLIVHMQTLGIAIIFYTIITLLLVVALAHSPQDKSYRMFFPGLAVFVLMMAHGSYYAYEEDKHQRTIELYKQLIDTEYDKIMTVLSKPDRYVKPTIYFSRDNFDAVVINPTSSTAEMNFVIPVPRGFIQEPVPSRLNKGKKRVEFQSIFRNPLNGELFMVIVERSLYMKELHCFKRFTEDGQLTLIIIDKPFYPASVFEHFHQASSVSIHVNNAINYFIKGNNRDDVITRDGGSNKNRVIQYDENIIVSRFSGNLDAEGDHNGKDFQQINLLFAEFLIAAFPPFYSRHN